MRISTQQSLLSRLWFTCQKTTRIVRNHSFLFPTKSTNSIHILQLIALKIPSEDEQYCTIRSLYRSPWQAFFTANISYGFTVHEKTRKKSTAFPARQRYVQIRWAEFRYDRTVNVQTADTTPLTPANKVWLSMHHATGCIT